MIRLGGLVLYVLAFSLYAFRDWFKSLCALILLIAVMEHPDMPKNVFGVQGFNPWNVLLLAVLLAWLLSRREEGLDFDLPPHLVILFGLYLTVVGVGLARMMLDPGELLDRFAMKELWSEDLINAVKWLIPALLLYDGARTPSRQALAITSIVGVYLLFAVQVIKWMPPEFALSGGDLSERALKIIRNEIGYSRVSMSMLLAGGSWALLSLLPLVTRFWQKGLLLLGFLAMVYAQALTGGRMGYVAWAVVGLVVGAVRVRKYLLLAPVVVLLVVKLAPGAVERTLQGFDREDAAADRPVDEYSVTSGRTLAWPLVIAAIKERPLFGYGQQAMIRIGLATELGEEGFPHPHNAYLEFILDNGWVGFIPILLLFTALLFHTGRAFLATDDPVTSAVGGATASLLLAFLICGIGSHSFYPRANTMGLGAALGLMLRVSVDRAREGSTVPLVGEAITERPGTP